jgi:hypothetical protein
MLNSQHYRAKAAEYQDRASTTDNLEEIRDFGELADNAEWMEKNSEKIVHAPGKGIHHR